MREEGANPMNPDLPSSVERDIERFAQEEHITFDEAVLRLIESGLSPHPSGEACQGRHKVAQRDRAGIRDAFVA